MRFFPVACGLVALRSWGAMSPSLARAAGIHGVPLCRYLWRSVLPLQRSAIMTAMLLVGLLATAEIGMVLLRPGLRARNRCRCTSFRSSAIAAYSTLATQPVTVDLALAVGMLVVTWSVAGSGQTPTAYGLSSRPEQKLWSNHGVVRCLLRHHGRGAPGHPRSVWLRKIDCVAAPGRPRGPGCRLGFAKRRARLAARPNLVGAAPPGYIAGVSGFGTVAQSIGARARWASLGLPLSRSKRQADS